MSEGPLPENWADAARWLLGGVFVFVAGFEGYVMLFDDRITAGLTSVAIAFALTGVLVRWKQIEVWAGTQFAESSKRTFTHPATWVGTIALVLLLIALSPFIEEKATPTWSVGVAIGCASLVAGLVVGIIGTRICHRTSPKNRIAASPILQAGLYVGDMRFSIVNLKDDRHSDWGIRVFNGTGRVVEFVRISGQLKFNAPNSSDPAHAGTLPTPSLRADTARAVHPLKEWFLMLDQRVPAVEADKILAMIDAEIPVHIQLGELKIEVSAQDERQIVERLQLFDGVTYSKTNGYGRSIHATGTATAMARAEVR